MAEELPVWYVAPPDPNIGRRVDTYFTLRTLLGRGGMGAAYLAEHDGGRIKCVIKLVLAELAQHPMVINRWKVESQALSLLKHDNIVRLENFGALDDGQLFMRFELINGTSLYKYVSEHGVAGRLSIRDAAYLSFQTCDAMDFAHTHGVIHRDLKPDNLMVEIEPPGSHLHARIKVLDFGIAKAPSLNGEQTRTGTVLGTPGFMAPEQAVNAAGVTGKADVFSLATIFYLAVTGRLPWGVPESDAAIYHKQQTQPPEAPDPTLMPASITQVIFRALSLRPDDRPTMREFAEQLAAAISPEGRLPGGTEILRDVKRAWVTKVPPNSRTVPRPSAIPDTSSPPEMPVDLAIGGAAAAGQDAAGGASAEPERASSNDMLITARGRPRAIAASLAARNAPSFSAVPQAPALARASVTDGPLTTQQPLMAALPTGMASQQFDAQVVTGSGIRVASIVVADEIEMAIGTPTPVTRDEDSLPAVVVSETLLRAGMAPTSPAGLVAPPPAAPELVPTLVPPAAPPSTATEYVPALVHPEVGVHGATTPSPPEATSPPPFTPSPAMITASDQRARHRTLMGATVVAVLVAVACFVLVRRGPEGELPHAPATSTVGRELVNRDSLAPVGAGASNLGGAPPAQPAVPTPLAPASGSAMNAPAPALQAEVSPSGGANTQPHKLDQDKPKRQAPAVVDAVTASEAREKVAPSRSASQPVRAEAVRPGMLTVFVQPWALVYIDGRQLDQTPVVRERVPAGRHRLRLVNPTLNKDEAVTITVTAEAVTTIERHW